MSVGKLTITNYNSFLLDLFVVVRRQLTKLELEAEHRFPCNCSGHFLRNLRVSYA